MSIQSVQRVSDILSLFSVERPRWGITEIAKALGLAKTTVSSLMKTLQAQGFLVQEPDTRRYMLGPRLFALGIIAGETLDINQKAELPAKQLAEKTRLVCRVAIWDRNAALVTLDVTPRFADSLSRRIGPRVAAYCSSLGRSLLAYLPAHEVNAYLDMTPLEPFTEKTIRDRDKLLEELQNTRQRGYALNDREMSLVTASVAATIFRSGGTPAAAISLTGDPERILGKEHASLTADLRQTASDISRQLGHAPENPRVNR